MKAVKVLVVFVFCWLAAVPLLGQQVRVEAENRPLNQVLRDLHELYKLQLSFDDGKLARYTVDVTATFPDPDSAIATLLSGLPLQYEKDGDVFVIYAIRKKRRTSTFGISGRVVEKGSGEPLPYSHVLFNGRGTVTDQHGGFVFNSTTDSVFQVKVSHLGYYILDTLLYPSRQVVLELTPASIGLTEIVIQDKRVELSTQIGYQAGTEKLNHKVATFLPGYGDNSVFNLLRLQPGILASGEQTNELVIWGSYEGHSKVTFDGFTVYGLRNFNDNISTFNPLMAKDIEVLKGGYDARWGERVGGIVNINGKNGNLEKFAFTLVANNMTLNGLMEIPVSKKSSLVIAFRQTYYNLYNPEEMNFFSRNDNDTTQSVELTVVPDYHFRDLNVKYSAHLGKSDLFYVSLYAGGDEFLYSIDEPVDNYVIDKQTQEDNTQIGGSVFYGKTWGNGNTSHFNLNYAGLKNNYDDDLKIVVPSINKTFYLKNLVSENIIGELSLVSDNRFALNETHTLETGLEFKFNNVELQEDTFGVSQVDISAHAQRMNFYLQDVMSLGRHITLKGGFRINYAFNLEKMYLEPRISLSVKGDSPWRFNMAWGLYNQFIAKSSTVDDLGNYRYIWVICDNDEIPVLQAMHTVVGTSYNRNNLTVSLEAYYKTTSGLTRFVSFPNKDILEISKGDGYSVGLDVMVKKDFHGHSAWLSYSLSKTMETFDYFKYFKYDGYVEAPQDQRHELKLALLLNFDPFYVSSDYVYGSGFHRLPAGQTTGKTETIPYNRWDVGFIYKFLDRRWKGEAGLSILNVLNTQNIKYSNFERIPAYLTNTIGIYAEAIPFTPTLYLKISF